MAVVKAAVQKEDSSPKPGDRQRRPPRFVLIFVVFVLVVVQGLVSPQTLLRPGSLGCVFFLSLWVRCGSRSGGLELWAAWRLPEAEL